MKLETLQFRYDIRSMDDEKGIVTGYASVFDNYIPGYNEVVRQGAFTKTLKENKGKVPIFRSHNAERQIGHGFTATQDDNGLLVEGEILKDDIQDAREEWALMKQAHAIGAPRGISIGFTTIKEGVAERFKGFAKVREILEARLFEWSPTPFPANTKAGVTQLRNRYIERDDEEIIETLSDIEKNINPLELEAVMNALDRLNTGQAGHKESESGMLHSLDDLIIKLRSINSLWKM